MIVVDTSAIVAILLQEPGNDGFADCMARAERIRISAATLAGTGIVAFSRLGNPGLEAISSLMRRLDVGIHEVDARQSASAIEACKRFGRGAGHPAKPNFGDCFSYASAKALGLPLLFKGDDFVHTDIRSAMATA